jgi:hypothetical protein
MLWIFLIGFGLSVFARLPGLFLSTACLAVFSMTHEFDHANLTFTLPLLILAKIGVLQAGYVTGMASRVFASSFHAQLVSLKLDRAV